MRLFCFPYAGGTAEFFNRLALGLSPAVEMVSLEYAGHGTRRREPLYQDFAQLGDDLYAAVRRLRRPGEGYALFGYSMGCIAVAEVLACILRRGEFPAPDRVFLAAYEPFDRHDLPREDQWVRERTVSLGGVPERLRENRTFWRLYLPLYRADYRLTADYQFSKLTLACEIPLTAFRGEQDTLSGRIEGWRRYFHGECEFVEFPGGHFFIKERWQDIAELIERRLCGGGENGGI